MLSTLVTNGLGDRIMDIIGLGAISRILYDAPVTVYWNTQHQHFAWGPASYNTGLFVFDSHIILENYKGQPVSIHNIYPSVTFAPLPVWKWLGGGNNSISFDQLLDYYKESGMSIQPSPSLALQIPKDMGEYIAIHLRRTDKLYADEGITHPHATSTKEYDDIMRRMTEYIELLIASREYNFFVLSDDAAYKEEFITWLESKSVNVLSFPRTGVCDPDFDIFEWFCMSRCKMILQGIKYSTFSMSASLINNVPLKNFSEFHVRHLINAWAVLDSISAENDNNIFSCMDKVMNEWEPLRINGAESYARYKDIE